ncbi:MAG: alpha/beta hydrolase [Cyanobacteria bacterium P01_G01_bin.19]
MNTADNIRQVRYGSEKVHDINIFYREVGDSSKQAIVLLHGFPSSSHQYREVLSALGDEFYVIAPDYPGFGYSEKPSIEEYTYTFDNLAETMTKFLEQKGISNYFLTIHDYGAPVGFRIATKHPERVSGFIVMNGNAYEEGLSELSLQTLSQTRSPEDEAAKIGGFMSLDGIKWMYTEGTRNPDSLNPDGWHLDRAIISDPHVTVLNLELLYDYPNNIPLYADWQQYLRDTQPPMLIVWGKNDPIFLEQGAAAYQKDVRNIDYHVFDTGHFPLEEDAPQIIEKMREFLRARVKANGISS